MTWREMTLESPLPYGIVGTVFLAPQEGMGWNRLCLQLGLNLSITTQHGKLGNHGVLGKILPSCHGQGPIGACHWERCISGRQ